MFGGNALSRSLGVVRARPGLRVLAVLLTMCGAAPTAAVAQNNDPVKRPQWEFGIAPYGWLASVNGVAGTLPPASPVDVDASFGDVLENFRIGAMFYAQLRRGRWGFDLDLFYVSLDPSATSPRERVSGDLDLDTFFVTPGITYRIFDYRAFFIELFAGARVWNVSTDLKLTTVRLGDFKRSFDETWVDPLIGIQGRINVENSNFYVSGWAKVGGFGVGSRMTWEVFGGIGYEIKQWVSVFVGYRHLEVNRRNNDFVFDLSFTGPVIGAVFRFGLGN